MSDTAQFPPQLEQALARFQRRWLILHTLRVIGLFVFIPLLSFGFLALSDRLWATPAPVRLLLAGPVPVLLLLCLWPWLKQWVLRKPDARTLARVMGRLDRRIGDQLLGAVELSDSLHQSPGDSPALRRAAIEQVARQLADVRAEEKLDTRTLRKLSAITSGLLLFGFLYVFLVPDAARNSFTRWLNPHREIERFTFVRFGGLPDTLNIAHGEPFSFSGTVSHVRDQPVQGVDVRLNGPERLEATLQYGTLLVSGEGLTQPRYVSLRSGDAKAGVRIEPLLRPELTALAATIEWPAYLGREPEEQTLRRRRLEVPLGSQVALRGTVSRSLQNARGAGLPSLSVDGADFLVPPIPLSENRTLELEWTDEAGLTPRTPATVELIGRPDEPPRVSIAGLAPAIAVLPDEFVNFEVRAGDDYGLERVWTRMRVVREGIPDDRLEDLDITGLSGSHAITFSPDRAGFVAGDMIDLTALALDAYPGREPSTSARHRILVMSHEAHAQMVHQQMEGVLSELDELIRQESLALEENRMLAERDPEDFADESTAAELAERALEEMLRAERLQDTQTRMENLIAESTKNETISDEAIADWTEIAQELQNTARPAMQAAAMEMQAAAQASGEPGSAGEAGEAGENGEEGAESETADSERRERLEEAMRRQEEALAAMQQGEQDLNESLERSLSESFVNRLRELARIQGEIGGVMQELLPQTIGLSADQLPEDLAARVQAEAARQEEVFRETRYVFDDLNGFYRRTRQDILREVTVDMEAERFSVRLPELRELILRNVIGRTTREAEEWRGLYARWAEMLSDEEDAGGGEGGDGGGEQEGEDLETMIALVRARERQERLRRHTRTLDESYLENMNYDREAVELSDRQYDLGMTLQRLENRVRTEDVKQLISMASGEIMNAGVQLRRPQTDSETRATQTLVIELLAAALDQSMGSPPPEGGEDGEQEQAQQQQNQQMLQALMQMMQGMRPGDQGGEGMTGAGDPGRAAMGRAGTAGRRDPDSEASGAAVNPDRWPSEYRNLIEAYYEAMEGRE